MFSFNVRRPVCMPPLHCCEVDGRLREGDTVGKQNYANTLLSFSPSSSALSLFISIIPVVSMCKLRHEMSAEFPRLTRLKKQNGCGWNFSATSSFLSGDVNRLDTDKTCKDVSSDGEKKNKRHLWENKMSPSVTFSWKQTPFFYHPDRKLEETKAPKWMSSPSYAFSLNRRRPCYIDEDGIHFQIWCSAAQLLWKEGGVCL